MQTKIYREVQDLIEGYGNIMVKQWNSFVKLYPDDLRKLCLDLISPSLIKLTDFFGAAIAKIDDILWLDFYFPVGDSFKIVRFYSDLILSCSKRAKEAVEFWGQILAGERMVVLDIAPLVEANNAAFDRILDKCGISDNVKEDLDDDVSAILVEPFVDKLLELGEHKGEYKAEIKFNIDDAPREMLLDDFRRMWNIPERVKEFRFVFTGYIHKWSDDRPYIRDLGLILRSAMACDYCTLGITRYQQFLKRYVFFDTEKALTAAMVCAEFLREKLKS